MTRTPTPDPPPAHSLSNNSAALRDEALLEGLPLGVVRLDHTGIIRSLNTEAARLFSGSAHQYQGQHFADVWSALTRLDRDIIQQQLAAVAEDGRPLQSAVVDVQPPSGDTTPVEWTCLSIDLEGTRSLVISLRDVLREQEVQQDRDRLATIADESPYPIIELDQHASLLYANPVMTELLARHGYEDDGFPRIVPRTLPSLVTECLSLGMAIHGEEVRLPEASFSWIFCPVIAHAHVRGYAVELTAVHRAQHALQRTADELHTNNRRLDGALQEAHAATQTKAAFLATITHELRTPMNGVIGMTSLLLETTMTPEQRTYAETIRQCGEALLLLINDVLECSKIEAGKLELECVDFNLRTTVDNVLRQFAEPAESKNLELIGLVHTSVPTALRGDPDRLRQVLTNLVSNAIKFTERGEVSLHACLEEEGADAALIRFEISDSGIGIHPDTVAKLFRPFVQADSSTTRKYGGTGLGLSISKQLVELMGGRIGVQSAPGRGSTFWCTARFQKQACEDSASTPLAQLQARRILIVDDNASNRLILRHLTSAWGMRVDQAESADHALQQIAAAESEQDPYHCAILDVMMPQKDGLQLAEEIQHRASSRSIRLIMMTSILQRGHVERARQVGVRAYLTKPVRYEELRDCLRTVLEIDSVATEAGTLPESLPLPLVTRHTLPEQGARPTILIVEDNAINQKLAAKMVEKLGYHTDVAENGQDALAAIEANRYAAVLMDCQMPVMDGFAATHAIRAQEAAGKTYGHSGHLPIIAVTANAMQGDRERCLAAGMDDYLAKPIKLSHVRETLSRWVTLPPTDTTATIGVSPPSGTLYHHGVFNPVQMRRNIGDDEELVTQLIDHFLKQHQDVPVNIRKALSQNDAKAIAVLAHTLKGTAGNLCAAEVALTASRLEALGNLGTLEDAPRLCTQLEADLHRLVHALHAYHALETPGRHKAA